MKFHPVSVAVAHLGNLLAPFDRLVFFNKQSLVVRVGRQKGIVVFENDQVAIAAQTRTGVHHPAISRRQHGVASLAGNIKPFVFGLIKTGYQRALRGPDPAHVFIAIGRRCWRTRRWHCSCSRPRRYCRRHLHRRDGAGCDGPRHCLGFTGRRNDAKHLADFNQIGVFKGVPAHDVAPVLAVLQPDANDGVAGFNSVVTGFSSVFYAWQGLGGSIKPCCCGARQTGTAVFNRCLVQRA